MPRLTRREYAVLVVIAILVVGSCVFSALGSSDVATIFIALLLGVVATLLLVAFSSFRKFRKGEIRARNAARRRSVAQLRLIKAMSKTAAHSAQTIERDLELIRFSQSVVTQATAETRAQLQEIEARIAQISTEFQEALSATSDFSADVAASLLSPPDAVNS